MKNRFLYCLSAVLFFALTVSAHAQQHCCGPITPAGQKLSNLLDTFNVESLWLAGQHVDWETGVPDKGPGYEGEGTHTHCSAFAASVAKRLGIYLLRPPEHGQVLLSNAQAEWLPSADGKKAGWRPVRGMREAQKLGNEGNLVVAVYQAPDKHKPGHVAIVRPSERSETRLEEDGPELIMAGQHNHNKVNTRVGFEHHAGAWPSSIQYYVHSIP